MVKFSEGGAVTLEVEMRFCSLNAIEFATYHRNWSFSTTLRGGHNAKVAMCTASGVSMLMKVEIIFT